MTIPLNRATLQVLPNTVARPGFDPAAVRPGIVHLGLGGFHRAHMAAYTHRLMELDPAASRWGIIGAGLLPGDRRMSESLDPQDGLYTLMEREETKEAVTVIASLAGTVFAGENSATLLRHMEDPQVRIVSLTVTENGYCLNRATKRLNPAHPTVAADLAAPATPRSAVGILVEALRRRRDAGTPPFTALSCDNIQGNGAVLRDAVLDLAALHDRRLHDWIGAQVSFPSTMVDRITPATSDVDRARLAAEYGVVDRWPVVCEDFTQWVIEDRFPAGRPAWERVGAQFVADVAPYEAMKLRLLNTSHLAVAGLGRLIGYETIDAAMADPLVAAFMQALMDRETGPTLPPVPGVDLTAYKRTLVRRFTSSAIKDTVERVNTDAPLNVLLDPIRDRLAAGLPLPLLALALAAWLWRMRGEDEQGRPIAVRHPLAPLLREKAMEGGPDPRPLLGIAELFDEAGRDEQLIGPVARWLTMLHSEGAVSTLRQTAAENFDSPG